MLEDGILRIAYLYDGSGLESMLLKTLITYLARDMLRLHFSPWVGDVLYARGRCTSTEFIIQEKFCNLANSYSEIFVTIDRGF